MEERADVKILSRDITGLLCLRLAGLGLQLAAQLVVGRLAGPAGLGIVQLFTSWTCVLGEVSALGRPSHAMKSLAVARDRASRQGLDRYLSQQVRGIALPWGVALLLALPVILGLKERGEFILLVLLASGCFALLRLFSEGLKALERPGISVLVETCGPSLAVLLACAGLWLGGKDIGGAALAISLAVGFALSMLVLAVLLAARLLQNSSDKVGGADTVAPSTLSALLPFWGGGVLSILLAQLPFLLLPFYADVNTTGQFALAYKLVNLVGAILLLMAAIYGPRFARAWHDSPEALRSLLWHSQRSALLLFAAPALALLLFGAPILAFFGEGFGAARPCLLILLGGQLVNAATGLPGVLLNMAGQARLEIRCLLLALLVACAGCLWLGPEYGALGVAVAYSLALAIKNLASWGLAWQLSRRTPAAARETAL